MRVERNLRICLLFSVLALSACARRSADPQMQLAPTQRPEVHWNEPAWAYRVGPALMATASTDSARISAELAAKAAVLGCDAVVSVVIPRSTDGGDTRPWGFCVFRVRSTKDVQ